MPPPGQRTELQELVESPNETLGVEYKGWLDLANDTPARANLARHIAALANFGGGKLVFGFSDDMAFAGPNPHNFAYNRDLISGIVRRYLDPTFQCDVFDIVSAAGNSHPVIVVPAHGATPICAKGGGPEVNGRATCIVRGTYYLRKPGPESAPIVEGADWTAVIRRCVMHDRASLLEHIGSALRGPIAPPEQQVDALKRFHDAAHAAFLGLVAAAPNAPPNLGLWHWQLSYAIERADGQNLAPNRLNQILREVNAEVTDTVRTGWSMLHIFDRPEIAPYFVTDPASGMGEQDFLECALLRAADDNAAAIGQDFWRVSPNGMVSLVRDYWEDSQEWTRHHGLARGTLFDPNRMVRALAEIIRHARGLSERFDAPTDVTFRIEWHGLLNRRLHNLHAYWRDRGAARSDQRAITGTWSVDALAADSPQIVATLSAVVARVFDIEEVITPDWVQGTAPTWLRYQ